MCHYLIQHLILQPDFKPRQDYDMHSLNDLLQHGNWISTWAMKQNRLNSEKQCVYIESDCVIFIIESAIEIYWLK